MKLWIDDMRDAPDESWTCIRKVEPAIKFLSKYNPTHISLDHDIENRPDDETFKPIAYYIGMKYNEDWQKMLANQDVSYEVWSPVITIHSINSVGAKETQQILSDYGLTSTRIPYKKDMDRLEKLTGYNLYGPDEDSSDIS